MGNERRIAARAPQWPDMTDDLSEQHPGRIVSPARFSRGKSEVMRLGAAAISRVGDSVRVAVGEHTNSSGRGTTSCPRCVRAPAVTIRKY